MAREYTSEEILAMQKDAVRRVAQMRKLSQTRVQQPPAPVQKEEPPPALQSNEPSGLLDTLFSDSESLLILAVLFLLIREKADAKLILALFYLLL